MINYMTVYSLPELPYDYAALEPHISGADHGAAPLQAPRGLRRRRQHRPRQARGGARGRRLATVANLLREEPRLPPRRPHQPLGLLEQPLARTAATSPKANSPPRSTTSSARFDKFRSHFTANANAIQGSGWSILAWDTIGQQLIIVQLYDQQGNVPLGLTPLLMLDMWEHAFYLDYQNVKARLRQGLLEHRQLGRRRRSASTAARTQTAGLIVPA